MLFFSLSYSSCISTNKETPLVPILYIDMDGTMLGSDHKIREATIVALNNFKQKGGKFGIATGRTLKEVKKNYLSALKPNMPLVLSNGALIASSDGRQVLKSWTISKDVLSETLSYGAQNNDKIHGIMVQSQNEVVIDRENKIFRDFINKYAPKEDRIDKTLTLKKGESPIKIMIVTNYEDAENISDKLRKKLKGRASVFASHNTVQLSGNNINKANAIKFILKDTEYSLDKDVVTIGDSGNDLDMLSEAKFGFAVKNCRPYACKAADAIIGPNDSNAIANLIENLLMP